MTERAPWVRRPGSLHAEVRDPSDGRATLTLLHGFTQTSRSWDPFLEELDPTIGIVRVDLPGHGLSGHETADLDGIADLVAETCGSGTYLGYSMGGRVALHIALRHPYLVTRLMLIGATPGIRDDDERAERRRHDDVLAASIERDGVPVFIDRWLDNPLFAGLPRRPADIADRRRNTARGLAESLRHAGTGTQRSLWEQLPHLTMPVSVIVGADDQKFATIAREMVDILGPLATLHLVEGAGHTAHLEKPRDVARLVEQIVRH